MKRHSQILIMLLTGSLGGMAIGGVAMYLAGEKIGTIDILAACMLAGCIMSLVVYVFFMIVQKKSHDTLYGQVLDAVSSGDLTEESMPDQERGLGDEFLWKLRDMVLNLRRVVGKVQLVSERVKEVSTEVADRSRDLSNVSRNQTRIADATFSAVEDIFESLDRVGTSISQINELAVATAQELGEMLKSIDEVDNVLASLFEFVSESAAAVHEMNANMEHVAANVMLLKDAAEDTETSVKALDSEIASVERSVEEAAELSNKSARVAEEGRGVIKGALEGLNKVARSVSEVTGDMNRLDRRSEEIGSIVGVISTIAEQTNLLALNASILAAQAGEKGKGFGVVASEIRTLSDRTRRSTTEVAELIESIQGEIAEVVDKLEESDRLAKDGTEMGVAAEQALKEIQEQTRGVSEVMNTIAAAAKRQAESSGRITNATRQVGEMVARVGAAAVEQARTSSEIAKKAKVLEELASKAKKEMGEQAEGSRTIGESMRRVTTFLNEVEEASKELSQGGERIRNAMAEIQQHTRQVSESSTMLSKAVEQLKLEAMLLDDEVHKFKLPIARYGGYVRIPLVERDVVESTQGLAPAHTTSLSQWEVISCMYEGLVAWGGAMELIPGLAESWDIAEDGRVYRFKLRKGVRFHNGEPLTATDVKESFQRVLDPDIDSPNSWIFADIEGADEFTSKKSGELKGLKVISEDEVEIRLKGPRSFFLYALTMAGAYVTSAKSSGNGIPSFSGTGPFLLDSYEPGKYIKLKKNEDYFKEGLPYLDGIEFRLNYSNREEMFAALKNGDVDLSMDLPVSFRGAPAEEAGRLSVVSMVQLSTHMFGFQCQTPPFNDKRVRQAIKLLMDATAYMEKRSSSSVRAKGILPPGMLGHDPNREPFRLDVSRARKLLEEAGIEPGTVITFWNRTTDTGVAEDMKALLGAFDQVGLKLEIAEVDGKEFWKLMRQGRLPFFRTTWIADYPDPDTFMYFLFNSKAQNLYNIGYRNERVDELTTRAREVLDTDARAAMYREAEDIVLDDTPFIPIYHDRAFAAHRPEVHGCQLYLAPPPVRLYELWLAEFSGRI